jgi:hypothetical protein
MVAAIPEAIEGLYSTDEEIRLYSINSLSHHGEQAAAAIPHLIKLLNDPDEDIGRLALRALSFMGPATSAHKALIIEYLKNPRSGLRQAAAFFLGSLGHAAAETAPLLAEMIMDEAAGVGIHAQLALARVSEDVEDAVHHLKHALRNESEQSRQAAEELFRQTYASTQENPPELKDTSPVFEPVGRPSVRELLDDELQELMQQADSARALIGLNHSKDKPAAIVGVLANFVNDNRELADSHFAEMIALYGEMVRAAAGWSWIEMSYSRKAQQVFYCLVDREHRFALAVARLMATVIDAPQQRNLLVSVFGSILRGGPPLPTAPGKLMVFG